ncbi:hypothetical protein B9T33_04975 [Acinetobacter sp. ANC 5054]|uniref:hypothetical protein n=1 Tax=Acinetobacter sp. ANC 5054 TaxID=1977877 RepID=UPI000A32F287|nr:hypothetical protein [Acinetobacter sp. ANC 5054]OTG82803.1 hypothetical protein B9T33_04975 [Acinetobacter sp. ANC 5054]
MKISQIILVASLISLSVQLLAEVLALAKPLAPKGWNILMATTGDLNKDQMSDVAMIIEKQKNDIIHKNEDGKIIHDNPRKLIVFFKTAQGYQQIVENSSIPVAEQPNSCLLDPLAETEGVVIKKGNISIDFSFFMSCGGWEWPRHNYTFRWQNQRFDLIGFDYNSFHRASGEETSKSYNFSTLKSKEILGGNMFEDTQTQTKWSTFKAPQQLTLKNINFDDFYTQFEY